MAGITEWTCRMDARLGRRFIVAPSNAVDWMSIEWTTRAGDYAAFAQVKCATERHHLHGQNDPSERPIYMRKAKGESYKMRDIVGASGRIRRTGAADGTSRFTANPL